mmetsp:Transcript_2193/g.6199  ORF Transcript_2193/g.6199 Transcript_2193/m.6199 type:complete len:139 (+) Transcript_2193:69-485(+)
MWLKMPVTAASTKTLLARAFIYTHSPEIGLRATYQPQCLAVRHKYGSRKRELKVSVHGAGVNVNDCQVAEVRYFAGQVLPNTVDAQVAGDEDKMRVHVEASVFHLSCTQHFGPHLLGPPSRCEEELSWQQAMRHALCI